MTSQRGTSWSRMTSKPATSIKLAPEDDRKTGSRTTFGGLTLSQKLHHHLGNLPGSQHPNTNGGKIYIVRQPGQALSNHLRPNRLDPENPLGGLNRQRRHNRHGKAAQSGGSFYVRRDSGPRRRIVPCDAQYHRPRSHGKTVPQPGGGGILLPLPSWTAKTLIITAML